jgi:hypothetical protein
MLLPPPESANHQFDKPQTYASAAIVALHPDYMNHDVEESVNRRVNRLRYIRSTMRAAVYIEQFPTEPRDGDEARLTAMYERRQWHKEIGDDDQGKKKKGKKGDLKKVLDQVVDLRKNNAIRRFGSIPMSSAVNFRQPSRFATDIEMQSDVFVLWRSQTWPGICDTARASHGRGQYSQIRY